MLRNARLSASDMGIPPPYYPKYRPFPQGDGANAVGATPRDVN
jgi:hypothetical protein